MSKEPSQNTESSQEMPPREPRDVIESALREHPSLTREKAIEIAEAFGF